MMGGYTMIAILVITLVGLLGCSLAYPIAGECIARGENSNAFVLLYALMSRVAIS